MKTITARFGLLFIVFLLPAPSVLGTASVDHKVTCEQVGDLALKVMYERQSTEQLDPPESSMNWEDKILSAGISLRAAQVLIQSDPDEKLESIVKFGELMYEDCKSRKLGLIQQYVGNQPAPAEQNANAQLFDIMELLQQELQSLRGQVEELAFNLKRIKEDHKHRYLDLDRRIVTLTTLPVVDQDNQAAMVVTTTDVAPSFEAELLGRMSMLEKEYDSISSFRQSTNNKLNTLHNQIISLAYGGDLPEAIPPAFTLTEAIGYISQKVRDNWIRPANARTGMEVGLMIKLNLVGRIIDVRVIHHDGSDEFVESVIQALKRVGSFEKLADLDRKVFDKNFREFTLQFKPEDLQ